MINSVCENVKAHKLVMNEVYRNMLVVVVDGIKDLIRGHGKPH